MGFLQLVSFELSQEEFAVEINFVNGIIKCRDYSISKIPNSPKELEGFINLRGKITPVYNLKKKFQYEDTDIIPDSKIIVVSSNDSNIGFIVDEVTDIYKINDENIEPFPSNLSCSYINGIGKIENKLIAILDLFKSLSQKDISQIQSIKSMTV